MPKNKSFDLEFRCADTDDADLVYALEEEAFPDPWTLSSITETINFRYAKTLIAYLNEGSGEEAAAAGFIVLYDTGEDVDIARIGVKKAHRRLGIGRGLVNKAIEWANELKRSALTLDVRAGNEGAIAFYNTMGFKIDCIRKNFYQKPKEDAVLMSVNIYGGNIC
ncbi:MAG: ribosomal protein S18-alanine N-acetyltransferase [Lachnospiraceae bacterium]|nr:ribosomal protein S18-alanine N-acetyltransferase [Lachnospiraceae bacterium]